MIKHLLFPLTNYSSPNGYNVAKTHLKPETYSMHFHDCIEITLLAKGTGRQSINGTEYYMPTYTLTIMSQRDFHRYYDLSSDNLLYNLMVFPGLLPDEMRKTIESLPYDKICTLPENVGKSIVSIMQALSYSQNSNQDYPPNFASSLCENLVNVFQYYYTLSTSSTGKTKGSILQNSLVYINENFTTSISLEEISQQAKCSPSYLSELFHKKIGMTVKQYINAMRIKHAKRMLISSDIPIMNICFDCGFTSLASFNRNFYMLEKISPSAYRKLHANASLKNAEQ